MNFKSATSQASRDPTQGCKAYSQLRPTAHNWRVLAFISEVYRNIARLSIVPGELEATASQ